ncbi:MAG TPA: carboxypeptidase-like regulatory domain-containing protein [Terracidiphilus sp.]|nr:carboxypeptidase-like regulatory domain-containing protein [Terracidiphilus sp.]
MTWLRVFRISKLCALALLSAASVFAREFHGAITFAGLPLPGATITATHDGKKFTTVTDQSGLFHFDDLPDGVWTIQIDMQCFEPIRAQVTVSANAPAGNYEMKLLPADQLMARTKVVQNPILAAPALAKRPEEKKPEQEANNPPPEMPKPPENGDEQSADGYLVNGSVNNSATSRYSTNPAFGNTRSGLRGLYTGGISVNIANSALDARPYSISGVEAPKSAYDLITDTAYIGGPIRIPHLLPRGPNFFVNYTWTRDNNAAMVTGLVPTLDERSGNLAGLLNALGQPVTIYNPATGQPYQGNQVPVSQQAAALLALYPMPNPNIPTTSGYNYQAPVLNGTHSDAMNSRLDKQLGRRDGLYGGLNFTSTRSDSVSLFDFVDDTGTLGLTGYVHWMHRFGGHYFVNTGYNFSRYRTETTPFFANRIDVSGPGDANITGNDQTPANWGPPSLSFSSGMAGLSDGNSAFNRNETNSGSLNVGIYERRHNISTGGDFRRQEYNDFFQQNPRGSLSFTGAATANAAESATTGSDFADFLIGIPDTSSIAFGNADKYFREPVYDVFFTDDWRVLPILTINAGVRWEYSAPMTELFGRLVNLDINSSFTAAAPVLGSDPVGPVTGVHYPSSLIRPDRAGIQPRIGISWRPIAASTVVIRAGYGVYRDSSVYQSIVNQMAQQASLPNTTSFSIQNNPASCPLTLSKFSVPASTCVAGTLDTFAIDPDYRIGYAQVWQLTVQRDLPFALQMVATYMGTKGTHGAQQMVPNTYPIGATDTCPDCPSDFTYRLSGGNSTRQSGQLQLRRRLKNGFTATLNYTWSKSIDDDAILGGQGYTSSNVQGPSGSAAIAQNWLDLRGERGLSTFDQRQLVNLTAQYTSGEGLGGGTLMSGWRGRLLKEWTLLGTMSEGTGFPETPIYAIAVPGTGYTGVIRPSLTGAAIYTSGPSHVSAAAYTAPAPGQWGTAGRDSITGPNQFTLNSSLARTFRPHGKIYVDLTVSADNVLNHPEYTAWNTSWNDASLANAELFGRPTSANGMRTVSTLLRVRF